MKQYRPGKHRQGLSIGLACCMTSLSPYLAVFLNGLACLTRIACQPQQYGPSKYQFLYRQMQAMSDKDETVYRPVPPDALYLAAEDISGE